MLVSNEAKRSKIWRIVTSVTSVIIVVFAAYLLIKLFMTNPVEGTWKSDDSNLTLTFKGNHTMNAEIMDLADGTGIKVKMDYSIDKEEKIIIIEEDEDEIQRVVKNADGKFTEEALRNAIYAINTSFNYSVDQDVLTLTEREYGDQMTFTRQ